jgi:hypothetical protein
MFDVQEAAPDDGPGWRDVWTNAGRETARGFVRVDKSVDEEPAPEHAEDRGSRGRCAHD